MSVSEDDLRLGRILTLDFTEKLIRLDAFIRGAAGSARHQDAQVVASLLDASGAIRRSSRPLFNLFSRRFSPLSDTEFESAIELLNNCFLALDRVHLQLSLIHVGWPTPEAYTFVSEVCEALFKRNTLVSIVLSDVYMFEETELGRYLGSVAGVPADGDDSGVPALFLPKIEHENPLQWGILIHELGHSLKWTSEPLLEGQPHLADSSESRLVFDNWAEEVFCDLLALYVLGPSYLVSFVSFINLIGPVGHLEESTETHPDPRFRLSVMSGILKRLKISITTQQGEDLADFFQALFEQRCYAERRRDVQWFEPRKFPMDFSEFRDLLEERATTLLPDIAAAMPAFDQEQLQELVRMLEKGIPIGGRRKSDTKERVARALSEEVPADPEDARSSTMKLLDGVFEERSTVADVLAAGWLYKTQSLYPRSIKALFETDTKEFDDAEIQFRDDVVRLDELLRKSIELMPLFRRFGTPTGDPQRTAPSTR